VRHAPEPQVLLAHMGGPFWRGKDAAAWSLPKGLVEPGESDLDAAIREFGEELGIPAPSVAYEHLGDFRYSSGKIVAVFTAVVDDLDLSGFDPGTFQLELRGGLVAFPEVDDVRWLPLGQAREKLVKGQRAALDALSTRP
jgi:predicted NUDIX family NTP pyrophosphohydrolase